MSTIGSIPIDLADHYPVAWEANGNATLVHRRTGVVLLFAPDHAFTHVTPLPGCPNYTLHRIEGADTFAAWVEALAAQWLDAISPR